MLKKLENHSSVLFFLCVYVACFWDRIQEDKFSVRGIHT